MKDLSGLVKNELKEALLNEMNLSIIKMMDNNKIQEVKSLFNLNTKRSTEKALIFAKHEYLKLNNLDYFQKGATTVLCEVVDGKIIKEIYSF